MADITLVNAIPSELYERQIPLGLLYLTSSLERAGYQVDVRDYQVSPRATRLDSAPLLAFLDDPAPVVGFSCYVDMLPIVVEAARHLKAAYPRTKIFLGGAGPNAVAEQIISRFHWIDGVVRGEGEAAIVELMEALPSGDLSDILGLVYRAKDQTIRNPARPRNVHLNALPLPAYDRVDWSEYDTARIVTSRGCPYKCTFCDVPVLWGRQWVKRDLAAVVQEIQLLQDQYGVRRLCLADDTFVVDRQRVLDFCHQIRAAGLNIDWKCYGRVNLMDEALMDALARAGCASVYYGVESGSERTLRQVGKGFAVEEAEEVIERSRDYFEDVTASYIWGFPFETLHDFQQTLASAGRLARHIGVTVQLHFLTPIPGTPIYEHYRDRIIFSRDAMEQIGLIRSFVPQLLAYERFTPSLQTLVNEHPDIFVFFYCFDSPDLSTKGATIRQINELCAGLMGWFKAHPQSRERIITGALPSPGWLPRSHEADIALNWAGFVAKRSLEPILTSVQ